MKEEKGGERKGRRKEKGGKRRREEPVKEEGGGGQQRELEARARRVHLSKRRRSEYKVVNKKRHSIFWRLVHSLGLGYILHRQSKDQFWNANFPTKHEGFFFSSLP
jgi:hypothetical protein